MPKLWIYNADGSKNDEQNYTYRYNVANSQRKTDHHAELQPKASGTTALIIDWTAVQAHYRPERAGSRIIRPRLRRRHRNRWKASDRAPRQSRP